jgi:predicted N-acyltransferase
MHAISCPGKAISKMLSDCQNTVDETANQGITTQIVYSTDNLPMDWSIISNQVAYFLQKPYLAAIENCPPAGMRFAYLLFYQNNTPIGIAYAQIFKFNTYESLKHHRSLQDTSRWTELKKKVAQRLEFYSIVCGNVLMTGEYGFYFVKEKERGFEIVNEGLEQLQGELSKKGIKANITLLKDFYKPQNTEFTEFGQFQIQPAMVIHLRKEWQKFDDYLAAMSSKYRVRAKRAFKKGKEIEKRSLSVDDLRKDADRMFDLYTQIVESAGFNGIHLSKNYFQNLKEKLGDDFEVVGYYLENELIGFYTVFLTENEIESHYLGIDQCENQNCQVYLNMLYDMVKMGIYYQKERIALARTALEIKSSVGAEPHELYFYMKHKNPLWNRFITNIFNWFNPDEAWTQRRPFKN